MFRRLLALSVLVFVLCLSPSIASESSPDFLLRASDFMITLQPTAGPNNMSNCLLLLPTGKFYLSLRRQEIMDGTATVRNFEGSIDLKALQWLRSFLDGQDVRKLPPFEPPHLNRTDTYNVFEAQVMRGSTLQQVGYYEWSGKGTDYPNTLTQQWRDSQAKLQPLVEWFRGLKTSKYPLKRPISKSAPDVCD
jgi:hypothetical protein